MEHGLAHIALQAVAHHMTVVLHKIVHTHLDQIDDQQHRRPEQEHVPHFVGHIDVDDVARNGRIKQIRQRNHHRTDHVPVEQLPVRLVKPDKVLQHFH